MRYLIFFYIIVDIFLNYLEAQKLFYSILLYFTFWFFILEKSTSPVTFCTKLSNVRDINKNIQASGYKITSYCFKNTTDYFAEYKKRLSKLSS